MITDNAQQIIKRLIERFQTGDIAPLVDIAILKLTSHIDIPASHWSFCNQILAYWQTGELDCRGFRQWEQSHRHVLKGSHAVYILGPCTIKTKDDEGEHIKLIGFKSIPVFPASMTDGEPIPQPESLEPAALPPLHQVAQAWGINIVYIPCDGRKYGSFSQGENKIRLATHAESVYFHELAHAAHNHIETLKGGQDPRQETIAEFTACVLMQIYGLTDTTGNTWQYIQSYNPNDPVKAIMEALETINKVLTLILDTSNLLPA